MSRDERNARRRERYAAQAAERKASGAPSERTARRQRAAALRPEAAQASRVRENQRKTLRRMMSQLPITPEGRASALAAPYTDAYAQLSLTLELRRKWLRGGEKDEGYASPDYRAVYEQVKGTPEESRYWYHDKKVEIPE